MKNIVLFGGSNSIRLDSIQKGLKEYANVTNLAVGATHCIQNLYELLRERNQDAIKKADLIVAESNINEIDNHNLSPIDLQLLTWQIELFYKVLHDTHRKICVVLLPGFIPNRENIEKINNIHRKLINYYGFNVIDAHNIYVKNDLENFGFKFGAHQLSVINRNIGKNIAKNIDVFTISNKKIENLSLPNFKIITPNEMEKHGDFKVFNPKNSAFDEVVYRLEKDNYLSLKNYKDWYLIGLHSWNLERDGTISNKGWTPCMSYWSGVVIETEPKIIKNMSLMNEFCDIQAVGKITDKTIIKWNINNEPFTETHLMANQKVVALKEYMPHFDLIGILLCDNYDEKTLLNIDEIPNDEIIKIDPELDFTHLVPNVEFFRDCMEFIDEYAPRLYGGIERHIQAKFINTQNAKITSLENENNALKNEILALQNGNKIKALEIGNKKISNNLKKFQNELKSTQISAVKRIQNHLSYKLGKAMIENSKSIFGYFKMPFVLWRIKKDHKLTQKLNEILSLPKIETLSDYKEALKYKNHLSYKLGAAMMKATKTWYKGGFIKLIFEIQKIKKEHKK